MQTGNSNGGSRCIADAQVRHVPRLFWERWPETLARNREISSPRRLLDRLWIHELGGWLRAHAAGWIGEQTQRERTGRSKMGLSLPS